MEPPIMPLTKATTVVKKFIYLWDEPGISEGFE